MAYELENAFIKMLDEREDFTSTSFVPTRTLERRKGWSVEQPDPTQRGFLDPGRMGPFYEEEEDDTIYNQGGRVGYIYGGPTPGGHHPGIGDTNQGGDKGEDKGEDKE